MPFLTIKSVPSGAPSVNNDKSPVGHMWFTLTDANGNLIDYGFRPDPETGEGTITNDDGIRYINGPTFKYTIEITQQQYDAMKSFAKSTKAGTSDFSLHYDIFDAHQCIAFTYAAMQAGAQAVGVDLQNFSPNGINIFFVSGLFPNWESGNVTLLANAMKVNPSTTITLNPDGTIASSTTTLTNSNGAVVGSYTVTYGYDSSGNVNYSKGIQTDANGNPTSTTEAYKNPDGSLYMVSKDANGNKTYEETDNADGSYNSKSYTGNVLTYEETINADGSWNSKSYDSSGNLTKTEEVNADGSYTDTYYENGLKTKTEQVTVNADGSTTSNEKKYASDGTTLSETITVTSADGRNSTVTNKNGAGDTTSTEEWEYAYDAKNNLLSSTKRIKDAGENVISTDRKINSYDESGKKLYKEIVTDANGNLVSLIETRYDANGNIVVTVIVSYTYNGNGEPASRTETTTDANGNTTTNVHNYGVLPQALTNPVTNKTITGDLENKDVDPDTEGIQTDIDEWGNWITDPDKSEPGRADYFYDTTGNDRIDCRGGDDQVSCQNGGANWIVGGYGCDLLDGQYSSSCLIEGGADSDIIFGAVNGNSQLYGDSYGDRTTLITAGETATDSGVKGDIVAGGSGGGTNNLYGSNGYDILCGGTGNDLIVGGGGDDLIFGEIGALGVNVDDNYYDNYYWEYYIAVNGTDYTPVITGLSGSYNINAPASGNDVIYAGTGNDYVYSMDNTRGNNVAYVRNIISFRQKIKHQKHHNKWRRFSQCENLRRAA